MNGDVEFAAEERECFLAPGKPTIAAEDFQPLLTRDDLMRLDSREPCWKRARLSLFIIFWIIWLGLLAAAVLIIVFTPRCPPRPNLEFWQSKVGYWIDPFAFKDSGNDKIGDIRGLMDSLSYIKEEIGAGYILLGSFVSGHYTNGRNELGLTENFTKVDPALGNMDDLRSMVRLFHKNGVEVVVTLDFNSVSVDHPWTEDNLLLKTGIPQKLVGLTGSL